MSADAKLKAYIDRILRCREAEDEAKQDTKYVYAELAADGYEKAIVGQVVTFLRKREKDGDKLSEQSAKFDLYLEAYERPLHAHTREERSDGGLSILTKHEDIRTAPVTAEEACRASEAAAPVTGRPAEPVNSLPTEGCGYAHTEGNATQSGVTAGETATNLPETATRPGQDVQSPSQRALAGENLDVTAGETATISPEEAEEEFPSAEREDRAAANAGGTDVARSALRAGLADPTSNTGEGAANTALPANGVTMEYVPASGAKRLPFAHCFPELSKADYERLERDIAANRVQTPIIRRDDVIIDGWARYMISRQYGMSYPVVEYTGCDILLDVIEWQRASRNFTQAQEKKIAADLAKAMPDRADDIMAAFNLAEELEAAE